jgi:PadR family transcriptional regulator, regulatory protein AphA
MSPRPAIPLRLEYALLGFFRRQPMHGYDLLLELQKPGGLSEVWRIKPGSLYVALEKLEETGFLSATMIPGVNHPQRKQYAITPQGETAFLEWFKEPLSAARYLRQDFMAKMYFIDDVNAAARQALFAGQIERCRQWQGSLQQPAADSSEYEKLLTRFRLSQVEAILQWLETISAETL